MDQELKRHRSYLQAIFETPELQAIFGTPKDNTADIYSQEVWMNWLVEKEVVGQTNSDHQKKACGTWFADVVRRALYRIDDIARRHCKEDSELEAKGLEWVRGCCQPPLESIVVEWGENLNMKQVIDDAFPPHCDSGLVTESTGRPDYEVFAGAYSRTPAFAVFPCYVTASRRRCWEVLQFGTQKQLECGIWFMGFGATVFEVGGAVCVALGANLIMSLWEGGVAASDFWLGPAVLAGGICYLCVGSRIAQANVGVGRNNVETLIRLVNDNSVGDVTREMHTVQGYFRCIDRRSAIFVSVLSLMGSAVLVCGCSWWVVSGASGQKPLSGDGESDMCEEVVGVDSEATTLQVGLPEVVADGRAGEAEVEQRGRWAWVGDGADAGR